MERSPDALVGHSDSAAALRGRVQFVWRRLADLHDEALAIPDGTVGKHTATTAISDAMDDLERALMALGPS